VVGNGAVGNNTSNNAAGNGTPPSGMAGNGKPRADTSPTARPSMSAEQQKAMKSCASLAPQRRQAY
jgi:hypothetical protein